MPRLSLAIGLAALAGVLGAEAAQAQPSRIIISRHGEKKDDASLCKVGKLRAQALAAQYLGKGAPANDTIFGKGGKPDAFFAVTVHTQETAQPSAESWGKQLTVFSEGGLDAETKGAAAALDLAAYNGKVVVVVWEHKHIAEEDSSGKEASDTLRALLKLDQIPGVDVPVKWEGDNYDYFWIVDYTGSQPTFTVIQQNYTDAAYAQVPNNAWGAKVDKSQFPEFYKDCEH
jgi:hypothetical protein